MNTLEIKASFSVDDTGTIAGIAWPFGEPDSVGDLIEPGAFRPAAAMPILYEHDAGRVIGVWEEIAETDAGLTVKGRLFLDSVPLAREVHSLVKRSKATGLSIGFRATESKTRPDGNRTIVALDLAEISIVRDPCHPAARILSVKSAGGAATPPHERTEMDPELKNEPELKSDPVITPEELKAIKSRLDKIEAKANRPVAANANHPGADNDNEVKAFIRHGGDVVRLRPSLRAAVILETRYSLFPVLTGIEQCSVEIIEAILDATAVDPIAARRLLIAKVDGHGVRQLQHLWKPIFDIVCASYGVGENPDEGYQQQRKEQAGKRVSMIEALATLYQIATGWLGWTPEQALSASPDQIIEAHKGFLAKHRALNGVADEASQYDPRNLPSDEEIADAKARLLHLAKGGR